MIEAVARAAGYRTGVYSSPHLVRFEERCRIDAQPVAADALLPHFEAVEQARAYILGAIAAGANVTTGRAQRPLNHGYAPVAQRVFQAL